MTVELRLAPYYFEKIISTTKAAEVHDTGELDLKILFQLL